MQLRRIFELQGDLTHGVNNLVLSLFVAVSSVDHCFLLHSYELLRFESHTDLLLGKTWKHVWSSHYALFDRGLNPLGRFLRFNSILPVPEGKQQPQHLPAPLLSQSCATSQPFKGRWRETNFVLLENISSHKTHATRRLLKTLGIPSVYTAPASFLELPV